MTQLPAPEEEIPQRFQRAAEVMAGKLWREQLREWDETYKPNAIAKHRELQAVDPDALSDDELVEYLGRCRDHHAAMITQHMRFTASAVVPTGDFLAHAGDWTGLPPAELLGLMRGASPVSAGASAELADLIAAIREDEAAQELLASDGDPGEVLASLRALDSPAGAAMNGYLDLVGNRLLDGFDISEPSALELPGRAAACDPHRRRGRSGGLGCRGADRRDPRQGAPGAPGGVRRAPRRGAAALPAARRARRLQRHLGLGNHAPRRARGWPPGRRERAHRRSGALRRCRLRRDVRARRGLGRPIGGRARRPRRVSAPRTAPRTRRRRSARRRRRRRTRPSCRRRSPG